MEFSLGTATFVTSSPWAEADYRRTLTEDPWLYGRGPRHIFLWDCRLEPGGNPPVPDFLALECRISAGRVAEGATAEDPAETATRLARLLADTGHASEADLTRALADRLPPLTLALEIPRPHPMLTDRNRVHGLGWCRYSDVVIARAQPGAVQYLLSIPRAMDVEVLVTGHCGPADPPFPHRVGQGQRYRRDRFVDRPLFHSVDPRHRLREDLAGEAAGYWWSERTADPAELKSFEDKMEAAAEARRQRHRARLKGD